MMELLAPAGDAEALRAAVCAGADAVYLGYAAFGARASATNFDAEALARAVEYAHLYRVRVHVTVNTLVKPMELEAVAEALQVISDCHADAIIVQDLGVARIARERYPSLALHASTQMALHTASGARWARERGFCRVVLARECSISVIAEAAQTGVETEVFVHGALCAGVSGQCLMSSLAGGRSGNRGRCAQPCRQQVTLGGETAALLSMKDLCLRDSLPALAEAGVRSLKIEGRLKRAEYVAVVTESYRRALDALEAGRFAPADEAERRGLAQIFQRGGFTVGHAMGAEDAALCATDRVDHGGVPIGAVERVRGPLADIRLTLPLNDGDSLRVSGASETELRYSGPDASGRAALRLRPGESVSPGDAVIRLTDARQLAAARAITEKPLFITMRADVRPDEPLRLTVSDGEATATVSGVPAQAPITRALTEADVRKQLEKLGDSPFALRSPDDLTVALSPAFAPVSALNALRRDALSARAEMRRTAFWQAGQKQLKPFAEPASAAEPAEPADLAATADVLAARFPDASMGQPLLDAGADTLIFEPWDWSNLPEQLSRLPAGAWLALPPWMSDAAYAAIRPELTAHTLAGVVLGSAGQLGFDLPLPIALGGGVPLTNPQAALELTAARPIAFASCWPEWSADDLAALDARLPLLLTEYGRATAMLLWHCPERVRRGLTRGHADCALCGPGMVCGREDAALTDRRGYRFPLTRTRMPEGCVVNVLSALPTDLSRWDNKRRSIGAGRLLRFTVEPPEEQLAITRAFAAGEPIARETTAGRFIRGAI